jgi:hypothetical protein
VSVISFTELAPVLPPSLSVRLNDELVEQVKRANEILARDGAVGDGRVWPERHLAKTRAQRLKALLVAAGLQQRWAVRERTWRADEGWKWSVERIGGM